MLGGIEDENRNLHLLNLGESQGILAGLAGVDCCLAVIVEPLQHGAQVPEGDVVVFDVCELENCPPVESSRFGVAAVDHAEHMLAWIIIIIIASRVELHAETEDILHGELEGGNEFKGGRLVEAGLPRFVLQDQWLRLEERLLVEVGQVGALKLCLGHQGWLLLGLLLKGLDGAAGC